MIGLGFLTKQQYKQMSGRAGRAGLDVVGESILVVQPTQKPSVIEMLRSPYDKCQSSLLYQDGCGLKALILNIVGLNIISTKSGLIDFLKQTFLWLQSNQNNMDNLLKNIECSLRYLVDNNFIELSKLNDENDFHNSVDLYIKATNMGKATLSGKHNDG
uniref:DNA polymerase theta-like helix-turn-helix domain-containing protein n=1 Tax=Romanomermis culicivorax TaxID=13658 RepID=A0A915L6V9_ROMCU